MGADPFPSKLQPSPRMSLWWSKYSHTTGLVIEHISPYRQRVMTPLLRNFGHTIKHRGGAILAAAPFLLAFVGIKKACLDANEQYHRSHWD